MMRKYCFFSILLCFSNTLFAQQKVFFRHSACGFNKRVYLNFAYVNTPDNEVLEYVLQICRAAAIDQHKFILKQSIDIDNALAITDENNHRIILYNPYFFKNLRTRAAKIAVLAHEIGHHLNSNTFDDDKRPEDELAADRFAGNILSRLHYRLQDAKNLLLENCSVLADDYYPAQSERIQAIAAGYGIAEREQHTALAATMAQKMIISPHMVTDDDGNTYKTFVFDHLRWTAANLNTNVGEYLSRSDNVDTCKKYGKYYTYDAAKEACARLGKGWRMPTFLEYQHLFTSNNGGYTDYETFGRNTPHGDPLKGLHNNMKGGVTGFNNIVSGFGFNAAQQIEYIDSQTKYWASNIPNDQVHDQSVQADYFYSFTFDTRLREITKQEYFSWGISERNSCRCVVPINAH